MKGLAALGLAVGLVAAARYLRRRTIGTFVASVALGGVFGGLCYGAANAAAFSAGFGPDFAHNPNNPVRFWDAVGTGIMLCSTIGLPLNAFGLLVLVLPATSAAGDKAGSVGFGLLLIAWGAIAGWLISGGLFAIGDINGFFSFPLGGLSCGCWTTFWWWFLRRRALLRQPGQGHAAT